MLGSGRLNDRLAQVERHIALEWTHVERQGAIVTQLEAGGHDTAGARNLLQQVVGILAVHVADRDRILGELYSLSRR